MYERMFRQGIVSPQRRLASKTLAESLTAEHAEMEAKLKESEAALQASRAKLRLMKAGSRKEDIAAARSELLRAQENANLLRVRMQHSRTLSPIEAIVSTRHVEPGDLARVGTRLITIVNTERLKIRTQISELDLPKVRLGQSVRVTFDAYRKKRFSGRILRIFPTVDPTSRQATIEVGMKNPDGAIPSGLLARLTFTSTADNKGLIVPKAALVRRVQGGKYEVFVAKKAAGKPAIRREGGPVARNGAAAAETGRTPGVRIRTGTNGGPPASGAREGVRPAVAGPNGAARKADRKVGIRARSHRGIQKDHRRGNRGRPCGSPLRAATGRPGRRQGAAPPSSREAPSESSSSLRSALHVAQPSQHSETDRDPDDRPLPARVGRDLDGQPARGLSSAHHLPPHHRRRGLSRRKPYGHRGGSDQGPGAGAGDDRRNPQDLFHLLRGPDVHQPFFPVRPGHRPGHAGHHHQGEPSAPEPARRHRSAPGVEIRPGAAPHPGVLSVLQDPHRHGPAHVGR